MIRLAVSSGMDVKRETTSKDIMISSGSSLRSSILVRKALVLLIVWGDVLTRGWRIMARCLDSSYVGDPGRGTIGLRGMFFLCILGSP